MQGCYFVGGIDTHVGKTIATGHIACTLWQLGLSVITQKLVQTGNNGVSDDILTHRQMMGIDLLTEDKTCLTMPAVFDYPASPHLSARLEGNPIDTDHLASCATTLASRYQIVLIEGAGGLMVPLTDRPDGGLIIDHIADQNYRVILVSSGRLGSINHTLLSLQALSLRGIRLHALAYNLFDDGDDTLILAETRRYLQAYLAKHHSDALWWEIPKYRHQNGRWFIV